MVPIASKRLQERLAFLSTLDPGNAEAFLKAVSAFKNGGVDVMILFGNESAVGLLRGILDHGPLDQLDWILAWILRSLGALDSPVPSFTVAVRADLENVDRFKSAWAGLDFDGASPATPATLTWTFVVEETYLGVQLDPLWAKRILLAEIDGYQLYQAPEMLGYSRS